MTKLYFPLLLLGLALVAAEPDLLKLPVKLEVPDQKPGEKISWNDYYIEARLTELAGKKKVVFLRPSARRDNAVIFPIPTDKLPEGEVMLRVQVNSENIDRFPFNGELQEKVSKKSLAAMKGSVIVKLKRIHFYDLTAQVVDARGKPITGESVILGVEKGRDKEMNSDKEGKVTFRHLSDQQTYKLLSGRVNDPLSSKFHRVTITPNQLRTLKDPIVLRIPAALVVADVFIQEVPGKLVPLPAKWQGPVRLGGMVPNKGTKSGWAYHSDGENARIKDGKLYVYQGITYGSDYDVFLPRHTEMGKQFVVVSEPLHVPPPGGKIEHPRVVVKKRETHPLRIRVINADDKKPIAGAEVELEEDVRPAFEGKTDKEGLISLKSFPEGLYRITVRAKGYQSNWARRKPAERPQFPPALKFFGEKTETVALVPYSTLTVRIQDRAGKPVSDVIALVIGLKPTGGESEGKADPKGIAQVRGLLDGEGFLIVANVLKDRFRFRYYGPVTVKGNTTTTVTLPPEIAVSGTVVGPAKLAGYRVAFVLQAQHFPVARAIVGKDGSYRLESIPGKYEVYLTDPEQQKFYPVGSVEVTGKMAKVKADFKITAEAWKKPLESQAVTKYQLTPQN